MFGCLVLEEEVVVVVVQMCVFQHAEFQPFHWGEPPALASCIVGTASVWHCIRLFLLLLVFRFYFSKLEVVS